MKLYITPYAWEKMRHYVDGCEGEVSGMGKVEKDEDGELMITDCTIFEQSVSGAHSDIEMEALAKFQVELVQKGEDLSLWKLWWHSHATMGVFWSGTDTDTINKSTEFEFLVSLVTNHKHEIKARVDTFKPLRLYADCTVEIMEEVDDELKALCTKEIAEKVKKPAIPAYKETRMGYGYGYGRGFQTGGRWFGDVSDDEWFGGVGVKDTKTARLPLAVEVGGDLNDKQIEDYYDTLEELENEVADAVDEGTLQVATQALWEHKQKGIQLGL